MRARSLRAEFNHTTLYQVHYIFFVNNILVRKMYMFSESLLSEPWLQDERCRGPRIRPREKNWCSVSDVECEAVGVSTHCILVSTGFTRCQRAACSQISGSRCHKPPGHCQGAGPSSSAVYCPQSAMWLLLSAVQDVSLPVIGRGSPLDTLSI